MILYTKSFRTSSQRQSKKKHRNDQQTFATESGGIMSNSRAMLHVQQASPYKAAVESELRNFRQSATVVADQSILSQHLARPKTAVYGLPQSSFNNQGKGRHKLHLFRKSVETASSAKRKHDSKDDGGVPIKLKSRP